MTTKPSAWCPGFNAGSDCTQPQLFTVTDLSVTNVTGLLNDFTTLNPTFWLTLYADVPGANAQVTFSCGGGTAPPQPIIHGAPAQIEEELRIHYADLKTYVTYPVPFTQEEAEVVLRRVSCDGVADLGTSMCQ